MTMILYNTHPLKLCVSTHFKHNKFKNVKRDISARIEKYAEVRLDFWDKLTITEAELPNLILFKAGLSYFMQCYWKRSGFNNELISLPFTLRFEDAKTLVLSKAQKNKKCYLRIKLLLDPLLFLNLTELEVYLDGIEVIALDAALHKAINMIQPREVIPDAAI